MILGSVFHLKHYHYESAIYGSGQSDLRRKKYFF